MNWQPTGGDLAASRRLEAERVQRIESRLSAALQEVQELRSRISEATRLLKEYFDCYGVQHSEDEIPDEDVPGSYHVCPEDDTCNCPLVCGINRAFELLENK